MGQLPKYKIEAIKKAQREAKHNKKRKVNVRNPYVNFLIVCEGTCTEPAYFEALISSRNSDVREVTIEGKGKGTVSLIKKAINIRNKSDKEFDRVWVVFDKDDFNDFNEAIKLAEQNSIHCAWSNESFELWYYLHFQLLETGISRVQYIEMIEREIRECMNNPEYKYQKRNPEIFNLLQQYGDEENAKRRAVRLRNLHRGTDYATHKPCTTVDKLVEELNHPEKLL